MTYANLGNGWMRVEMQRQMSGAGQQYVAVGFSTDGVDMGDDLVRHREIRKLCQVIACVSDGATGGSAILTQNTGTSGSPTMSTAVVRFPNPFQQAQHKLQMASNLRNSSVTVRSGQLACTTEISIAPLGNRGFALDADYSLLLAYGPASGASSRSSLHTDACFARRRSIAAVEHSRLRRRPPDGHVVRRQRGHAGGERWFVFPTNIIHSKSQEPTVRRGSIN